MGDSGEVVVVVVSQEGLLQAVSLDESAGYLKAGYRLATPAECDKYEQTQKRKSDLRE